MSAPGTHTDEGGPMADAIETPTPRCDKCGAEITTGLMAVFCQQGKECAFYTPELDDFMANLGLERRANG